MNNNRQIYIKVNFTVSFKKDKNSKQMSITEYGGVVLTLSDKLNLYNQEQSK